MRVDPVGLCMGHPAGVGTYQSVDLISVGAVGVDTYHSVGLISVGGC